MKSAPTWTWALGASVVAHGLLILLPSPGQATQNVAPTELRLSLRPPPPPEPEPEPEPPPPEPEPEVAPPPAPRPPPPRPTPRPDAPTEAPPDAPAEPEAPPPPKTPPKNVDLDLKPRWSDAGSLVRRVRGHARVEAEAPAPGLEPAGAGRYVYNHPGFEARVERDGSVRFRNKASFKFRGLISEVDLTEVAMKIAHDDPFRSDKLAFLENSRDFRAELRKKADHERLIQAEGDALARVRSIWRGPGSAVERRRRLFQMWDSCAEKGPEAQVAAGAFVRRTVLGFIERRLPAGHPDGFTSSELAGFNADRRSRDRFAPYGGTAGTLARDAEPTGEAETLP